jgi:hypothetical protein
LSPDYQEIKVFKKALLNVANFGHEYLLTTVANKIAFTKKFEKCQAVKNFLASRLLSKNINMKTASTRP